MKTENSISNVIDNAVKHSKLPFKVEYSEFGVFTIQNDEYDLGEIIGADLNEDEAEANAKLIVTAVNNHYKLIEALSGLVDEFKFAGALNYKASIRHSQRKEILNLLSELENNKQ